MTEVPFLRKFSWRLEYASTRVHEYEYLLVFTRILRCDHTIVSQAEPNTRASFDLLSNVTNLRNFTRTRRVVLFGYSARLGSARLGSRR